MHDASDRVVIIGAGPAGLAAARILVTAGLRPVVIEETGCPGGQGTRRLSSGIVPLRAQLFGKSEATAITHREADEDMVLSECDFRPRTLVWGSFENSLELLGPDGYETLPYRRLLLAPGATDRILPLPGWTLPGAFSLGGAQVALKRHTSFIGRRVVFAGASPLLYLAAAQYLRLGHRDLTILDTTPFAGKVRALPAMLRHSPGTTLHGLSLVAELRRGGASIHFGASLSRILGERQVEGIVWRDRNNCERSYTCDSVALGHGLRPDLSLAELSGATFRFDPILTEWFAGTDGDGRAGPRLWLAGDGARTGGASGAAAAGALAAYSILSDIGLSEGPARIRRRLRRKLRAQHRFQAAMARAFVLPTGNLAAQPATTIICRCERVTLNDIRNAITADCGPSEVNRIKSITRCGMGRCQGRFCGTALAVLTAQLRGVPLEDVGRLRAQAPVRPIPISEHHSEAPLWPEHPAATS